MPYVDQKIRDQLDEGATPENAGELNYLITRLVDGYLLDKGEIRYAHLNEVIGVLECAKQELYRRVVSPYEDTKIREAGDVYNIIESG